MATIFETAVCSCPNPRCNLTAIHASIEGVSESAAWRVYGSAKMTTGFRQIGPEHPLARKALLGLRRLARDRRDRPGFDALESGLTPEWAALLPVSLPFIEQAWLARVHGHAVGDAALAAWDAVGEDVRKKREQRIIYTLTTPPAGEARVYAAFIRKHRYEPRDRLSLVEARWHEQNEEWMTVRTIPVRLDGCPEGCRRRRVPAEVVDEIIRQCGGVV